MNEIEKQLEGLRSEQLTQDERGVLRTQIMNAVRVPAVMSAPKRARRRMFDSTHEVFPFTRKASTRLTASALVGGLLVLTASVSYAAEGALPGDLLYPVKIRVNEGVKKALAVGPKANAQLAEEQLRRRADEANKLEAEHRLSAETKAELVGNSQVHLADFARARGELKKRGADKDAEDMDRDLEQVLEDHKNDFVGLGIATTTTDALSTRSSFILDGEHGSKAAENTQDDMGEVRSRESADVTRRSGSKQRDEPASKINGQAAPVDTNAPEHDRRGSQDANVNTYEQSSETGKVEGAATSRESRGDSAKSERGD